MNRPSPLAVAVGGAVIISFSAIFFRASGADAVTGAFFRMAIAAPVLAIPAWRSRHEDSRSWRHRRLAFGAGVFLALDLISWLVAIDNIGAGLATLTANSQVIVVPLVTWMLLSERPSNRALWSMPVVMIGLALLTGLGRSDTFGDRPVFGVMIGVLAALFYSGFLILYRHSNRILAPVSRTLLDVVVAALAVLAIGGWVSGQIDLRPAPSTLAWLAAMAIGGQVVGWLAVGYALPRLSAASTSFAILLQPVLTMLWGATFFAETVSPTQATGVALVLAGILFAVRSPDG